MISDLKKSKKIYSQETLKGFYILVAANLLQIYIDKYEKSSFFIKLTNITLYVLCILCIVHLGFKTIASINSYNSILMLSVLLVIAISIIPTLTTFFFNIAQTQQTKLNLFLKTIINIYTYSFISCCSAKLIVNSKYFSAKNNKLSRFIKFYTIRFLLKLYKYNFSQRLVRRIGIDYLDLRKIKIPKDEDFFFRFYGKQINNVKLPYIDTHYYDLNGLYFKDSIFTKPTNDKDLESFIWLMYRLTDYTYIYNIPSADYSNISFKNLKLSKTHFDKECILPMDINLFQNIIGKDISKTELPIECLKNIHLYNLNEVLINLSLYDWYKDILTPSQITLIKRKYPSQINKNIILPY